MVSFGTTYRETREKNIDRIAQDMAEWLEKQPSGGRLKPCVYQAYSSKMVRRILKERDGIIMPDTTQALEQMREDGITHVSVLSTHIIEGLEHNKITQEANRCAGWFEQLSVSKALLTYKEDYREAAEALWQELQEQLRGDVLLLMGHGTSHEADESYVKMEQELRAVSGHRCYVATVEGAVTIELALQHMKQEGVMDGRVLTLPFMLVAGDHAIHDMAGEKESFVSILRENGYEPECLLKGLGEYEGIRRLYRKHIEEIFER